MIAYNKKGGCYEVSLITPGLFVSQRNNPYCDLLEIVMQI